MSPSAPVTHLQYPHGHLGPHCQLMTYLFYFHLNDSLPLLIRVYYTSNKLGHKGHNAATSGTRPSPTPTSLSPSRPKISSGAKNPWRRCPRESCPVSVAPVPRVVMSLTLCRPGAPRSCVVPGLRESCRSRS